VRTKQAARFAHLSDLHIGRSAENDANAVRLCAQLVESGIDQVVATGDLTHRGLARELEQFESIFAPRYRPGADGRRPRQPRLPRRRRFRRPHGWAAGADHDAIWPLHRARELHRAAQPFLDQGHSSLDDADLDAIDAALDATPAGVLVVIALHHHVLPMPDEHVAERLPSWLRFVFTSELARGRDLLKRVRGRCGLVLHGHRHVPRGARLFGPPRPMHVINAGSSTELGRVRVFSHDGRGLLLGRPLCLDIRAPWDDAAEAFGGESTFPAPLAV
jgi:Icc protein